MQESNPDILTLEQIMNVWAKAHEITQRLSLEDWGSFYLFGPGGSWHPPATEHLTIDQVLTMSNRPPARDDWVPDWVLAYALMQALQLAAEGVGRLSSQVRDNNPEVPWFEITELPEHFHRGDFRPLLAMAYSRLDTIMHAFWRVLNKLES